MKITISTNSAKGDFKKEFSNYDDVAAYVNWLEDWLNEHVGEIKIQVGVGTPNEREFEYLDELKAYLESKPKSNMRENDIMASLMIESIPGPKQNSFRTGSFSVTRGVTSMPSVGGLLK
jgi:hypothetical protein